MSSAVIPQPAEAVGARTRLADFVALTKPRIALLVLFTVAIGTVLASRGTIDLLLLFNTLAGTGLVAAGASALNQLLERDSDGRMRRTENRPLPAGRLQPVEVLVFGLVLSLGGLIYLSLTLEHLLPVLLVAFTLTSYVLIYTPLKRRTTFNTLIGAVPGALPPVIGWTAVTGRLDPPVVVLFLILFLWQVPHFLAIAWIYREDYRRAGLRMLPVMDPDGRMTGRQMLIYGLALIPVSVSPAMWQQANIFYALGAMLLGIGFFAAAVAFVCDPSLPRARRVLHASLLYLPLLLTLLVISNEH